VRPGSGAVAGLWPSRPPTGTGFAKRLALAACGCVGVAARQNVSRPPGAGGVEVGHDRGLPVGRENRSWVTWVRFMGIWAAQVLWVPPRTAAPAGCCLPSRVISWTSKRCAAECGRCTVANSQEGRPWYPNTVPTVPVGPVSGAAAKNDPWPARQPRAAGPAPQAVAHQAATPTATKKQWPKVATPEDRRGPPHSSRSNSRCSVRSDGAQPAVRPRIRRTWAAVRSGFSSFSASATASTSAGVRGWHCLGDGTSASNPPAW